jgi:hypothetical protein
LFFSALAGAAAYGVVVTEGWLRVVLVFVAVIFGLLLSYTVAMLAVVPLLGKSMPQLTEAFRRYERDDNEPGTG